MKIVWLVMSTLVVSAMFALSCGKSDDDDSEDAVPISALELTCGGKTCIGTEGE